MNQIDNQGYQTDGYHENHMQVDNLSSGSNEFYKEEVPLNSEPLSVIEEPGKEQYVLRKPVQFEGKEYREITLDFERLTGRDLEKASEAVGVLARGVVIEVSKGYQAAVACRAAGLPREFMDYVSGKDYTAITMKAMDFLMD